ncbi:DegT/DnrJ/EryC1/StrS family aminotransferase [Pelodictyon phaeoclathratiforme]|jgi:dTDP-4-amino-4,6-dideoxygalactose transaminase|uniref:DegT/DnrJ/EryC1/StrS aminotransferase n=1 Tax=Pelodictyon phaeoclathratiforme (strain DSM 5477 / BU-1) TaxID=324925 RepID=B4SDF2_PELPB|nr:DegT/DnrJ/EryC1/StrS aminotransferase family protein [Pelodictyon phaeoclathratiforme]ACF42891.1 DegT/DnrJ/EryC1/StrS aminotransferase [Pelodictyon phaeoclathratiforme BU-1]MBV5290493.1 DegT/DnrJ/EryC1/StrS aminotransferase family protein [Pelodictyon phaeoclathratiforme]
MLNTSFPPWPSFSVDEAEAVSRVVLSNRVNYWTGQECREFEREFALWAGCEYAVALANGTLALEVALKALGIGLGDEVVVTPRTFIASASCVVATGAVPVFADVDRDTQNIAADTVAQVLSPRTKAVICVHLAGMPCDMDPIIDLARERGLLVIEDCAQAHGAIYKGRPVGSIGHIGAWSFCQDKIMTTGGEGGMVTTNDRALRDAMWAYKDHGKSWRAVNEMYENTEQSSFQWLHESFGSNYRMLEMQAAIGRIQLRRMPEWSAKRRGYAGMIWNTARLFPWLRVPDVPDWAEHAAYKCYVFVVPSALPDGWDRDRVMAEINAQGVPCYSGSCSEIYLEKAFEGTGWRPAERLPVAKELGETSLMFLVHPTLEQEHIEKTCKVLQEVMSEAKR